MIPNNDLNIDRNIKLIVLNRINKDTLCKQCLAHVQFKSLILKSNTFLINTTIDTCYNLFIVLDSIAFTS